jgi:hypothetical protein
MHRPRLHADSAAASTLPLPVRSTQTRLSKPTVPAENGGIESQLQALKRTAQAYRKPHHWEAATLVLATVGCFLIPASAGKLLLSFQDWAFLATAALLVAWLMVRMRRRHAALNMHFDKELARINQTVADPSERLVYRSDVAKLRAECLAPGKFFESGSSLWAALVVYAVALLAAHTSNWMH